MSIHISSWATAFLLWSLGAATQHALAASSPPVDPDQPAARRLTHQSAFDGYKRLNDQPVSPWRDSNAGVAAAGGWRAYAKEAQQGHGTHTALSPSAPRAADPHAGHGTR